MSFADILSREALPLSEVKVSSDSSNVLDGLSLSIQRLQVSSKTKYTTKTRAINTNILSYSYPNFTEANNSMWQ